MKDFKLVLTQFDAGVSPICDYLGDVGVGSELNEQPK